jgi:hypothetical protein
MKFPSSVHRKLLAVPSTLLDAFAQREQMKLVIHDAKSFEELREIFAHSIYLVQPDDSQHYIINTDASAKAIEAVLMQNGKDGQINIVSTASRVLTPAAQRYATCQLELL